MSSTEASEETITICVCWMMLARPKSNLFRSCFGILFYSRLSNSPTLYVFVQRWSWTFLKCHRLFINTEQLSVISVQLMQMCPYWRPIFFTDPWTVLEGRKRLLIWHVWSSKKKEQSTNIALGIHRASQGVLSLIIQNFFPIETRWNDSLTLSWPSNCGWRAVCSFESSFQQCRCCVLWLE